MAERTVNVTINYKVNTAEVQKAQAASQAAQKATDDLRKATEQYGKASTTASKQAADATKSAASETSSLSREVSSLYSSVKLFLTAGLAKELLDAALNMAKLAGQMEGVTRAFNRLPNATLLLNDLRQATHGTVTDLELMQKALMAQNFRIPLEKLGTLLEFAAVKAQQTGQEVNHLVNYIVSGIGYRSIKRLDDLGFTANRVKTALGGVSLQAASMGEVMDAITKLMKEDLEATGGYAETAATDVDKLSTAMFDLRREVAEQATSRGLIQFFTDVIDKTRQAIKAQFSYLDALLLATNPLGLLQRRVELAKEVMLQEDITTEALKQADAFRKKNDEAKEGAQLLNTDKELFRIAQIIQLNEQEQKQNKDRVKTLNEEIEALRLKNKSTIGLQMNAGPVYQMIKAREKEIEITLDENKELENNKSMYAQVIQVLVDYRDGVKLASKNDEEAVGIIEKKRAEIEALQDQIEKTTRAGDLGATGKLTTSLKKAQSELDDLLGKSKEKQKEAGKEVRDYLEFLSDSEMLTTKELLEDKAAQRKRTADEEVKIEKEAKEKREKLAKEEAEMKKQLQRETLQLTEDFIRSSLDYVLESNDTEVSQIEDKYDKQLAMAGDNQRAQKEIQIQRDRDLDKARQAEKQREKKAAVTRIEIDGLIAIAKIFSEYGWPAGIPLAAIMAGITAVNVATVQKFATGVIGLNGPGTETSDSIPAMLSRGESVMTAQATRRSMGLLEAIQANKIDDRIMKSIDFSGGRSVNATLNDGRIVDELKAIRKSQYKLEEQAGMIYRVYTSDEGSKKRIRSRSI